MSYQRTTLLDGDALELTFQQTAAAGGDGILSALTAALDVAAVKKVVHPPPPGDEWVASFLARSTDVPEDARRLHIHARTSRFTKTVLDPHVNMLRVTTEAMASIQSANVAQIFDFGMYSEMPYIVMEYIAGGRTLAREMQERGASGRVLDADALRTLFHQLCLGLGAAHDVDIVRINDNRHGAVVYRHDAQPILLNNAWPIISATLTP